MPRNEIIRLTEREWDALVNSVERLSKATEQLERDALVFKAKAGVWMFILGGAGGLLMTLITHFALKHLP